MLTMTRIVAAAIGGAGLAALASAAQATAQYTPYGYGYGVTPQVAAQRCAAAVQYRLSNKATVRGYFEHIGGRVLSVTEVKPRGTIVRVRGLAASDRYAYDPYGYGAYGALGYAYSQPGDLSFRCDVDRRGRVLKVDINSRR